MATATKPAPGELAFSPARADRAQRFIERLCRHTKGRWAGRPFTLAEWQRDDIIRPLFGIVRYDEQFDEWVRLYHLAWLEIARKNGKSEIMAAIGLYLLAGDQEEGAEVYGAARDRDQAAFVYRVAKRMVELSPILSDRLTVIDSRKRIIDEASDSYYQVIAADAPGNLGQDPHGILFDEVIAQPSRELWDALVTGEGSRRQPLMIAATTAGNDPASFAKTEHDYSTRVAEQPDIDPARFVYIRNIPEAADPFDESLWPLANPALEGDDAFLSIEVLRNEARQAKENPATENRFRQFRANQWVQQASRWVPLEKWEGKGNDRRIVEAKLAGKQALGGLDLASSVDLAALCWDFPGPAKGEALEVEPGDEDAEKGEGPERAAGLIVREDGRILVPRQHHRAVWRHWLPEARLKDLDQRTGGQASVWADEGWLTITPGDVIDYEAIYRQIDEDLRTFDVPREGGIAYDRWGMVEMSRNLAEIAGDEDFVVPMGQGYTSMSPPTKAWERLIYEGLYQHGGDPLAAWQFNNIQVLADTAGNIKISKKHSGDKVDGMVAAVMALDRAMRFEPRKPKRAVSF